MSTHRNQTEATLRSQSAQARRRANAIESLRNEHGLRTSALPTDRVEDEGGVARLDGYWARSAAPARWLWGALWALTLGTVLALVNLPGIAPSTLRIARHTGAVVQGVGAMCIVAAEVSRRRSRTRALVELHLDSDAPPSIDAVVALEQAARGGEAWLVSAGMVPREALECAQQRRVRCFILVDQRLQELTALAPVPIAEGEA